MIFSSFFSLTAHQSFLSLFIKDPSSMGGMRWSPPLPFCGDDRVGMSHGGKKLYNSRKLDLDVARRDVSPRTRSEIRLVRRACIYA